MSVNPTDIVNNSGTGLSRHLIVMGVAGCGKSVVSRLLRDAIAQAAQGPGPEYHDADDYHSTQAKARMSAGIPLSDEDRMPWLRCLAALLQNSPPLILACSALKSSYRAMLNTLPADPGSLSAGSLAFPLFIYLKLSQQLAEERLRSREGHFAGDSLAGSQFVALEEPTSYEGIEVLTLDAGEAPQDLVRRVLGYLRV